jgi:hypothetical protein
MRRVLLLVLLALALPTMTWASSSIDFTNSGGTLSGSSSSGLSLSGSTLIAVNGLNGGGLITGNLGTLSLSTGALTSGSLTMGNGTFAAGGSFIITGNGTNGVPNGVIFNGTFSSPVSWTLVTLANGTHNYTLSGAIVGPSAVGATVQLTVNTGEGFFNGSVGISSGDTSLSVPEPGTLGLLGTGLVGIGGLMRRRLRIG